MTAGQEAVKFLKPFGCFLVLLVTVSGLILMFSSAKEPIKGYEPPQTSQYYRAHLDELKEELEENVFPEIGGVDRCEISGDTLTIYFTMPDHVIERAAILRYYDAALFTFYEPTQ